jgi:hypothetical protein
MNNTSKTGTAKKDELAREIGVLLNSPTDLDTCRDLFGDFSVFRDRFCDNRSECRNININFELINFPLQFVELPFFSFRGQEYGLNEGHCEGKSKFLLNFVAGGGE